MSTLYGTTATGKIMSAVDAFQGFIIGTLNAIFHQYEGAVVQFFQIIEQFIAHTIRTGSDNDSHHIFHLKSLFIHLPQLLHPGVCIGISLEISQIFHIRILPAEESLSLLQLFSNRLFPVAIAGIEGAVVAIRTSATRNPPISVRTGESRVYRNLLNTEIRKLLSDPCSKIVVIHWTLNFEL